MVDAGGSGPLSQIKRKKNVFLVMLFQKTHKCLTTNSFLCHKNIFDTFLEKCHDMILFVGKVSQLDTFLTGSANIFHFLFDKV